MTQKHLSEINSTFLSISFQSYRQEKRLGHGLNDYYNTSITKKEHEAVILNRQIALTITKY